MLELILYNLLETCMRHFFRRRVDIEHVRVFSGQAQNVSRIQGTGAPFHQRTTGHVHVKSGECPAAYCDLLRIIRMFKCSRTDDRPRTIFIFFWKTSLVFVSRMKTSRRRGISVRSTSIRSTAIRST